MTIYTADIKSDRPTADQAVRRVDMALATGLRGGHAAVKLIHGYGSTGKGGRIRTEARRYLGELKVKGKIQAFIAGEDFSIFNGETLWAFQACPALRQDSDLEKCNNGITIILL